MLILTHAALLLAADDPHLERVRKIGEFFCQSSLNGTTDKLKGSREVPDVVVVGQRIPDLLAKMRPGLIKGYKIEVQRGEPAAFVGQEPDSRVTHTLIIRCEDDAILLRMGYDSYRDRFHLVGYTGAEPLKPAK
ncbi:hypothetical protein [Prosthecobacter sp.]|uniref:hypothetical protein n=1 Tax=Prosthecobacter sp. TaxID=1965333 RepID=UPI002488D38F|nr:hypothetical protein [Prosthecobacter sp.]MDI1313911.1 hypothetical protein [Prosthecobacter sp.]